MDRIVVIGAGLTGGVAVAALREHGFRGRITLVGAEKTPPYSRPPLSKQYLRGEHTQPELVNPPSVYADVDLKLETRATRIDPKGKRVMLESGDDLLYDRLLVATVGAIVRLLCRARSSRAFSSFARSKTRAVYAPLRDLEHARRSPGWASSVARLPRRSVSSAWR